MTIKELIDRIGQEGVTPEILGLLRDLRLQVILDVSDGVAVVELMTTSLAIPFRILVMENDVAQANLDRDFQSTTLVSHNKMEDMRHGLFVDAEEYEIYVDGNLMEREDYED